ncbi:CoA-binding protein [Coemansia reversa NRRL 1564]|uniref:CoA-binding protein n=1 Tax=Coemansia reversa (strain ATCC 12441 / NRRL 1564) TaxID=763665 RepID=A0A2G5B5B5_COERN|nr:CoA-binding protein [Coemansia reversa NRRL 1564]|eukprot:PIA14196.1 CoA-binding protein [Coemansia reversa NRRL 1564]
MVASNGSFFASKAFAVVGASADKAKYGNKVLCWYLNKRLPVTPINPTAHSIEGLPCAKSLAELCSNSTDVSAEMSGISVSVITPPHVSEQILRQAATLGIRHVWFQPGSEPESLNALATELGVTVTGGGPCILVHSQSLLDQARL